MITQDHGCLRQDRFSNRICSDITQDFSQYVHLRWHFVDAVEQNLAIEREAVPLEGLQKLPHELAGLKFDAAEGGEIGAQQSDTPSPRHPRVISGLIMSRSCRIMCSFGLRKPFDNNNRSFCRWCSVHGPQYLSSGAPRAFVGSRHRRSCEEEISPFKGFSPVPDISQALFQSLTLGRPKR